MWLGSEMRSVIRTDQSLVRAKLAAAAYGDASECGIQMYSKVFKSLIGTGMWLGSDLIDLSLFDH